MCIAGPGPEVSHIVGYFKIIKKRKLEALMKAGIAKERINFAWRPVREPKEEEQREVDVLATLNNK